jgi:hypothetical protein
MAVKIIVVRIGNVPYPDCNNMVGRNFIADQLDIISPALRNPNIEVGVKGDFLPDSDGWTAFHVMGIGNNGKMWDAVFGVNLPAKDTGLGTSTGGGGKGGGEDPPI